MNRNFNLTFLIARRFAMLLQIVAVLIVVSQTAEADESVSLACQARLIQSTVRITWDDGLQGGTGSGVIVARDPQGFVVLTADHVVNVRAPLKVFSFSLETYPEPSHEFSHDVIVIAQDAAADLAVVQVRSEVVMPAELEICPADRVPRPPFQAIVAGCSEGEPPILYPSSVAAEIDQRLDGRDAKFFETNNRDPFPGESGGGIVTASGKLIGICSAGGPNRGVYSHVGEIRRILARARGTLTARQPIQCPANTRCPVCPFSITK